MGPDQQDHHLGLVQVCWFEGLCGLVMRSDFLNVQVGDVVAVHKSNEKPYLAQVLFVEGGARTADPNFLQVCRKPDCAVMNICPSWITQRLPRGPEPEPHDLSRRR